MNLITGREKDFYEDQKRDERMSVNQRDKQERDEWLVQIEQQREEENLHFQEETCIDKEADMWANV